MLCDTPRRRSVLTLIDRQALIYSHSYASLQRNGATSEAPNTASEERVAKYRILKSAALGVVFFGMQHIYTSPHSI